MEFNLKTLAETSVLVDFRMACIFFMLFTTNYQCIALGYGREATKEEQLNLNIKNVAELPIYFYYMLN